MIEISGNIETLHPDKEIVQSGWIWSAKQLQ